MQKVHDESYNDYWKNKPDLSTPIIAEQLNRNEHSVDAIDNRVIVLDTTKANQTDMLQAVKTIAYTESTGTFRITFFNNTYVDINTDLEKLAVNFDYDDDPQSAHYQNLIITLDDGTVKYVDLSALITQYEFLSTSTIQAVVGADGKISFNVINGSITEEKLEPNFLANCRIEVAKAQGYADSAESSAASAEESAQDSEAWAVGKRGGVDVPGTDETYHNNAKYWAEQAEGAVTGNDKVTWEANGVLGAKNLIPYPYYETTKTANGVTFTDNGDGTITVNGTATATASYFLVINTKSTPFQRGNYFLSGCPLGGSSTTYRLYYQPYSGGQWGTARSDEGNGVNVPIGDEEKCGILIRVYSGATVSNLTFKPMLRLAEDADGTYQPYAMTNRELTLGKASQAEVDDIVNVYGAKQMIPFPLSEDSKVMNGITWTNNGDGTITANGTASANSAFWAHIYTSGNMNLKKDVEYILSGVEATSSVSIYVASFNGTSQINIFNIANGEKEVKFKFTQDFDGVSVYARIANGTSVSNQLFKPMVRMASVSDDTYEPYAMTNKQLTDNKADKTDIATVESGTTASRAYSVGELVYVSGTLYRVKTAIASGATFTVGTNIEATNVSGVLKDSIIMVYDQYFTATGTGAAYIDIDQNYPMAGYKLIGLNIASNTVGYYAQARIRSDSRITGVIQKVNGGVIATGESTQIGVTLTYWKN